ncbi:MAG: four helix bundle protein [Bacteroidales bacterium]|jgi:four helix bundle protein|nr:four helix bundle protein [Bacteroidales bacterium]MDD4215378.1 four helix bundle protein [Bacteroidales bacterium]
MDRLPAKSFTDLIVWQKAHKLVLLVYNYSEKFSSKEMFGLTSQLRRAVVSVAANIAEGFKKRGKPDKIRFMNIAQGSLEECRYYFILANDLNYGKNDSLLEKAEEVSKLIEAYRNSILNSSS